MRGNPEEWEFTDRRREIAMAVASGMTNKEIGAVLNLSEATVKSHVRMLLAMFGLGSRVELVALAYREGWMPLPAPGGGWVVSDDLMLTVSQTFKALCDGRPGQAATAARENLHLLPHPSRIRTGPPKDPRPKPQPEDETQSLA